MEKVFTATKRQNKCSKGNLNSASGSVTCIPSTKKSFYNFIVRIMNSMTVCDVHVYTDSLQNDLKLRAWHHVINVKTSTAIKKKCNRVAQLNNYWLLSLCNAEMVVFEQAKLSKKTKITPTAHTENFCKGRRFVSLLVWSFQVGVSAMPQPSHE